MQRLVVLPVAAISLLFSATLAPTSAAAEGESESETVLEPTSPWQASYEDGRCRLTRVFAAPSGFHALVLEQRAPSAKFNLVLTGPALSGIKENADVRISFGPGG